MPGAPDEAVSAEPAVQSPAEESPSAQAPEDSATRTPGAAVPVPASPDLLPITPPLRTADLPPSGGRIGDAPEDFVVDEASAYPLSGEGPHLWVRLQKRGWNTRDAVRALARACGVQDRDCGTAGNKDRHALTTQWVSLPENASDPMAADLPEGLQVLEVGRHGNKLRTGHLSGNHFQLRLVEVQDFDAAAAIAAALVERGAWNAFGAQRFGHGGANLRKARRSAGFAFRERGKKGRFLAKLYPSVLQSEIFNRYLVARAALDMTRPLQGEVLRLSGSRSVFTVEDPAAELERWSTGDTQPTGPMPGGSAPRATGLAGALEEAALIEVLPETELRAALDRSARGTRRDLLIPLVELVCEREGDDTLLLSFFLPPGAYATQIVREFTLSPWIASAEDARGESA